MNTQTLTTDARTRLRAAWAAELDAARAARSSGDTSAEWTHLERAHILSQPMAGAARAHARRDARRRRCAATTGTNSSVSSSGSSSPHPDRSPASTRSATPAAPTSARSPHGHPRRPAAAAARHREAS